jgi:hypothetical protein
MKPSPNAEEMGEKSLLIIGKGLIPVNTWESVKIGSTRPAPRPTITLVRENKREENEEPRNPGKEFEKWNEPQVVSDPLDCHRVSATTKFLKSTVHSVSFLRSSVLPPFLPSWFPDWSLLVRIQIPESNSHAP